MEQALKLDGNLDLAFKMRLANFEYYHHYLRPDRLILYALFVVLRHSSRLTVALYNLTEILLLMPVAVACRAGFLYILYMFFNCLEKHRSVDIINGNKIYIKGYSSRWVQIDGDCFHESAEQNEKNCDTDVSIEFLT